MTTSTRAKAPSIFDRELLGPAVVESFRKLTPRHVAKNPVMFVVEVGSVLTTARSAAGPVRRKLGSADLVHGERDGLALVHGGVRELRRSRRGRPRQGPGERAAPDAPGHHGPADHGRGPDPGRSRLVSPQGRRGHRRGGHDGPRRRRDHRGHRLGGRVGDHRRVGARDPRERRRPLLGHRRHEGALRPDRRAHHGRRGRVVPRPHDRAGRGRRAPEDAQRDRAAHPAGRADRDLPVRDASRSRRSRSTRA